MSKPTFLTDSFEIFTQSCILICRVELIVSKPICLWSLITLSSFLDSLINKPDGTSKQISDNSIDNSSDDEDDSEQDVEGSADHQTDY